ncbi:MAG: hypothetical protein WCA39_07525 [Nitrososphaeraceae archaeon]
MGLEFDGLWEVFSIIKNSYDEPLLIKTLDLLKGDINIRNIKYDRYCLHELYLYEDMLPKTLRLEKPHSLRDYIKEAMSNNVQ